MPCLVKAGSRVQKGGQGPEGRVQKPGSGLGKWSQVPARHAEPKAGFSEECPAARDTAQRSLPRQLAAACSGLRKVWVVGTPPGSHRDDQYYPLTASSWDLGPCPPQLGPGSLCQAPADPRGALPAKQGCFHCLLWPAPEPKEGSQRLVHTDRVPLPCPLATTVKPLVSLVCGGEKDMLACVSSASGAGHPSCETGCSLESLTHQ